MGIIKYLNLWIFIGYVWLTNLEFPFAFYKSVLIANPVEQFFKKIVSIKKSQPEICCIRRDSLLKSRLREIFGWPSEICLYQQKNFMAMQLTKSFAGPTKFFC